MQRILWSLIFGLVLSPLAFAQFEIPVNVKADNLKYYEDSGLVEAWGSVEVKFKDATIYADNLRMDSVTNIATAEGRVRLFAKSYRATADYLLYDASQEVSTLSNFESKLSPKNVRGNLFISARSLRDNNSVMEGSGGTVTTCDYSIPHDYILADKVEYYPDDRIQGSNVTIYVGEMPVFWMPYLYYDLKRARRRNWEFGHNEVEGDYLKTAWNYPGGLFLLDSMEKKGLGYGVDTDYTSALGLGSLYLYLLDEKDTGIHDRVEKIEHHQQLNPWTTLKLNHSYVTTYLVPSGRVDQTSFGLNLNYADKARWNLGLSALDDRLGSYQKYALSFNQSLGRISTSYSINYDFAKNDPKWMRNSQRFSYQRPLFSDNITFSTTTNYYHSAASAGDSGEEKIEPQIEIRGSEKDYSWRYSENWFLDLRQDLSPGVPRYDFLEKQPEIEIYPRALDLKLFNLQSTFGYGHYREVRYVPQQGGRRDYATERYRATLNAGKTVALGLGTALTLGAGIDQFAYSPGDQLYAYRENGGLQTNLWSFFRNDLSYRKGYTDGNSPFFFDKLNTSYHDAREKMTFYYLDKFNWSIDGGRNYQTNKWYDVMTSLMVSPNKKWRWMVNTGWDIENTRYKDLVTSMRYSPYSFFALDLAAVQDMNIGELRSGSALWDVYFLEGAPNQMHVRVGQVFDPLTKEFKVRDIMVVKDLHCWEMRYSYSDYRKEFSFSFSLKALPGEPVGFSGGRGFYFDSFERELKGLKPEGAVRRY